MFPSLVSERVCVISFLFLKIYLFYLYLFLATLGLRCCVRAFSLVAASGGALRCSTRASRCGGFSCCGAWALGARASVVVVRGL